MRIILRFYPDTGNLVLPVHYNHIIQSMIYKHLDKDKASSLHERGFPYHKRRFKLFTFSRITSKKSEFDKRNKTITFHGYIQVKIASVDTDFLESLVTNIVRKKHIILNKQICYLHSVEIEAIPNIKGPIKVKTISPITIYRTLYKHSGKKYTFYYHPKDPEFEQLILENIARKVIAWFGKEDSYIQDGKYYVKTLNVKRLVITEYKKTWIKAWDGIFEINLPGSHFFIAYYAGLGAKNSQGFGMIEIIREQSHYTSPNNSLKASIKYSGAPASLHLSKGN